MSQIPAVSLDDFIYARGHGSRDLLKIDVEDGEADVLARMARLFAERLPVLVVSVHGGSSEMAST